MHEQYADHVFLNPFPSTHNGNISTLQDPTVVGGTSAGGLHAGVGTAALKSHRKKVALTVVGWTVIHNLCVCVCVCELEEICLQ